MGEMKNLKKLRASMSLTQAEAAEMVGIDTKKYQR